MNGKETKWEIVKSKVDSFCSLNPYKATVDEERKAILIEGEGKSITLSVEKDKVKCSDQDFQAKLMEEKLPAVQETGGKITSRSQAAGSSLETVRRTLDAKDKTYQVGDQEEAYAVEKIRAFEEMGGSYQIMSSEVTPDMARYHIRGTLPNGRYDESEYTVFRQQWMVDMAWDMVDKQMEKGNNILNLDCPALENGMPNLNPGASMKVKKSGKKGEVVTGWFDVPAAYYIATTVNKLWKFQRIQAQTKAKAKVAKELAGASDMLEAGELEDELRERAQVQGAKA